MGSDMKKNAYPNPLLRANYLSKILFWWVRDIIWRSSQHDFVAENLYDATPQDLSETLTFSLESNWIKEVADARQINKKPSLWKAIARTYLWDFSKFSALIVLYSVILTTHPQLLQQIIMYFQPASEITSQQAYLNATIFVLLIILRTVLTCQGCFHLHRLGMQARIACTSLIYKKLIRLPPSLNQKSNSSVISLLSVDVAKFEHLFIHGPFVFIVPVKLFIVTYTISQYVGLLSAVVGMALLVLQTFPVQVIYSKMALKFRAKQATRTDYRISLINEIINGIRIVKMYVWEKPFEKLMFIARGQEIANYLKISYLTSLATSMTPISYRLSTVAITLCYVLQNGIVTADKILPVMQHLFEMRTAIGIHFFFGVKSLIDMYVSMKRIEEFLLLDEVNSNAKAIDDKIEKVISIQNVTASWDDKSTLFQEINLDFAAKELSAIVGPVGSGKSSLLQLILGELPTASGKIFVGGNVSYASQEPWLFNGSVRDNILFAERYDEERYEKTINACALVEDFNQLPYGEKTLVGERGSNLSGGQRARINLARAVYRDADVYLLDDPLSAVDAVVSKHIMEHCVNGLLKDKARILITHGIQKLSQVSEIILLEHGKVKFRGSMKDLMQNSQFMTLLQTDEAEATIEPESKFEIDNLVKIEKPKITLTGKEPKETEELIAKGTMKSSVYLSYIRAGGWNWLAMVMLTNGLFVAVVSIFDFELGTWNNNHNILSKNGSNNNVTLSLDDTVHLNSSYEKYILTFAGLIALILLTSVSKGVVLCRFVFNASKKIHNDILSILMKTPLRFFAANSTGKILNRFSEDTGILDNALPQVVALTLNRFFHVIAMIVSTIIANWWIVIPSSLMTIITILMGKVYVRTIQKIKRLSGIATSPILSFVASTSEGLATIRACKAESIVIDDFNRFQDRRTAAVFLTVVLSQAFSFWLELISNGFIVLATYWFVIMKNDNSQDSYVGLTLMQILFIAEVVGFQVIQIAEALAHMTSVERILQFKELEQENLIEEEPAVEIPSVWPSNGEIVFDHLYLRYSDDTEPVLWDLTCRIKSGSKIGIVGRTGAGKSSIISALFRFAKFDGSIFIDGLDIKRMNLYEMRSKLSVLPQEPILLKASLRKNLDPLAKFDDSTLYSAIETVQLKSTLTSLDVAIERCGSNLSVGQRQLICLARAIVNKSKILILDEATANVDSATDAIIQKTIRSEFKDCTVLTIAHRLNTVMDSDKILVMDNGRLMEYAHPYILLQNKESYLYKLADQSGEAAIKHLAAIAEQAYINLETTEKVWRSDEIQ